MNQYKAGIFLRQGFNNGMLDHVPNLARITFKFCKSHGSWVPHRNAVFRRPTFCGIRSKTPITHSSFFLPQIKIHERLHRNRNFGFRKAVPDDRSISETETTSRSFNSRGIYQRTHVRWHWFHWPAILRKFSFIEFQSTRHSIYKLLTVWFFRVQTIDRMIWSLQFQRNDSVQSIFEERACKVGRVLADLIRRAKSQNFASSSDKIGFNTRTMEPVA